MKTIFLVLIACIYLYPQAGNTIPMQIDSVKNKNFTFRGQKNFMGTIPIKLNADTSVWLGGNYSGSYKRGLRLQHKIGANPFEFSKILEVSPQGDSTASFMISSLELNWASYFANEISFNLGYNTDGALSYRPNYGYIFEPEYHLADDTSTIFEQYSYFNNRPSATYIVRPFQTNTTEFGNKYGNASDFYYMTSCNFNVDYLWFGDESNHPLIEFRSSTYGLAKTAGGNHYDSGLGNSELIFLDSTTIRHSINNFPWLFQADNTGNAREIIRLNNHNNVMVAPNGFYSIELSSPIEGNINWRNYDSTGTVSIYRDTTNRIVVGGGDGLFTQRLSVGYFPSDTAGLASGKIIVDPTTGLLKYLLPLNLVTNGDFTNWSAYGTYSIPDNWSQPDTTVLSVEESPAGKLHITTNGSSAVQITSNDLQTAGVTYGYSFTVTEPVDSFLVYGGESGNAITEAGNYVGEFTSVTTNSLFAIVSPDDGNTHEITIDNIKVWVKDGTAKQTTYEYRTSPVNAWDISTSKTILLKRTTAFSNYDSLFIGDVQDSLCVQVYYMDGVTEYDMISTPDTLVAGDTTILFDQNRTPPQGDKVYMKFIYIGDNEADLKSQIYWRE